jgi:hypothetical protein
MFGTTTLCFAYIGSYSAVFLGGPWFQVIVLHGFHVWKLRRH